jgi:hypothetical protein
VLSVRLEKVAERGVLPDSAPAPVENGEWLQDCAAELGEAVRLRRKRRPGRAPGHVSCVGQRDHFCQAGEPRACCRLKSCRQQEGCHRGVEMVTDSEVAALY